MDIVMPISLLWDTGGFSAARWGDCGVRNAEVFHSTVVPYITEHFDKDRKIVVRLSPGASVPDDPHTYVLGDSDEYEVTQSETSESWKTPGSRKDFEKARKSGAIVLKPMRNCTVKTLGLPSIYPETPPLQQRGVVNFHRYGQNRISGGVCYNTGSFRSIPALEVDSLGSSSGYRRLRFNNAVTVPTSEQLLRDASRQLIVALDAIAPNKGLVTQVVSQANSATWDIATEVAEMPETIGYILNSIKRGITILLKAKRGMKQQIGSGSLSHDAASVWMQYRYAVMPIVYGINDALDVLGMDAVKFQSFRGRLDEDAPDVTLPGWKVVTKPRVNNRVFLKYKYDVDAKIHQGLKINFAATAWELIPLSFVFDWFFQVGDYLTALFRPGVVDSYGCQQSVKCQGQYILENDHFGSIIMDVDYYRVRIIDPDSYIGINSDVFISFKRSMDAIALSWLMFKKKGRRG